MHRSTHRHTGTQTYRQIGRQIAIAHKEQRVAKWKTKRVPEIHCQNELPAEDVQKETFVPIFHRFLKQALEGLVDFALRADQVLRSIGEIRPKPLVRAFLSL